MTEVKKESVSITGAGFLENVLVRNVGPDTVFVGHGETVSPENGFPILAGETVGLSFVRSFAAVSEGKSDVRLLSNAVSISSAGSTTTKSSSATARKKSTS